MSTYAVLAIAFVIACTVVAAVAWIGMRLRRPSQPSATAAQASVSSATPTIASALDAAHAAETAPAVAAPVETAPVVAAPVETTPAVAAAPETAPLASVAVAGFERAKTKSDNPAQAAFDNVAEYILRARYVVRSSQFPRRPQAEALLADADRCYGYAVAALHVDRTLPAFVLLRRAYGSAAQAASLAPSPAGPPDRNGMS